MRDETSLFRQESIEDDISTQPIEHNEHTLVENPEEDNNVAPRKSKRQRTAKSFGDDFIVYLMDDTPREPLKRHIHFLMLTIERKQ
jgi:predicted transcriptional regulator